MVTLTLKISSVKKRLGFITKVQGRLAGREHLLLNHPPLDPFASKGSMYNCSPTKSGECARKTDFTNFLYRICRYMDIQIYV